MMCERTIGITYQIYKWLSLILSLNVISVVNIQQARMAEGRRGKLKGKGEKRIKDNSWILSFKLFRLTEESWSRSKVGRKKIKNSGLVILYLKFLLNTYMKKPNRHLKQNLVIQIEILSRDTDLGVVSIQIVAEITGLDEVTKGEYIQRRKWGA